MLIVYIMEATFSNSRIFSPTVFEKEYASFENKKGRLEKKELNTASSNGTYRVSGKNNFTHY